jgi:hypothetical protein
MSETPGLSQKEADALLAMEKHRESDHAWTFPALGGKVSIPLVSYDRREHFLLDLSRGSIELRKAKLQSRARQIVVLARVDLFGTAHLNPDGEEVPCPHIHLYREGFGDKWAFALPREQFHDPDNLWVTLNDFLVYCSVDQPPTILRGVFS